jgi:hypothetical protein
LKCVKKEIEWYLLLAVGILPVLINYLFNEQAKEEKSQRRGRSGTARKGGDYRIKRQIKIIKGHVHGGGRLQDGDLLGRGPLQESCAKEVVVFGAGEARRLQEKAQKIFRQIQALRLLRVTMTPF